MGVLCGCVCRLAKGHGRRNTILLQMGALDPQASVGVRRRSVETRATTAKYPVLSPYLTPLGPFMRPEHKKCEMIDGG